MGTMSNNISDEFVAKSIDDLLEFPIVRYMLPLSIIGILVGTFGNMMSFCIVTKMELIFSIKFLLQVISISDFITVCNAIPFVIYHFNPLTQNSFLIFICSNVFVHAIDFFVGLSYLTYLNLMLHRFIAVCYPHNFKKWLPKERSIQIVLFSAIGVLISGIFLFNLSKPVPIKYENITIIKFVLNMDHMNSLFYRISFFIQIFFGVIVLLSVCLVLNFKLIQNYRSFLNRNQAQNANRIERERAMFILLNAMVILDTICSLPGIIAGMIFVFNKLSERLITILAPIAMVSEGLKIILPFYVNIVTNAEFRKTFLKMFHCANGVMPEN